MTSSVGAVLDFLIACLPFILLSSSMNFDLFQRERLRERQGEPFLSWEIFLFCFVQQFLGHVCVKRMKGLISIETSALCRWGNENRNLVSSN